MFGEGPECWVCFTGYGRNAKDYEVLAALMPSTKIIAINYFFEGEGGYPETRLNQNAIRKEEYVQLVRQILDTEGVNSFHLLAFSMGGRLSLCVLEEDLPVSSVIFMAPDGIMISRWHGFSASKVGQALYRALVLKRPRTFFKGVHTLRYIRVISPAMLKFLNYHLGTAEKRERVYQVWLSSHKLIPEHERVATHGYRFFLFLGKYDRIITAEIGHLFKKHIAEDVKIRWLECGHDMMQEDIFRAVLHTVNRE